MQIKWLEKINWMMSCDLQTNGSLGPCDGCTKGKHPQAPFPTSRSRAKKILDRLHMDLQGPFDVSIKGYRFVLAVIDDNSRMGWKKFLKLKGDTSGEIVISWKSGPQLYYTPELRAGVMTQLCLRTDI